ncbi:MAG: hypothetical protein ACTSVC_05550 [Promethearchaeota archaeon]
MVVLKGTVIKDEDDNIALKMRISPDNPELYEIPFEELFEEYLDKKVRIELTLIKNREEVFKDE